MRAMARVERAAKVAVATAGFLVLGGVLALGLWTWNVWVLEGPEHAEAVVRYNPRRVAPAEMVDTIEHLVTRPARLPAVPDADPRSSVVRLHVPPSLLRPSPYAPAITEIDIQGCFNKGLPY